jgi:hypothetical protein
LSKLKSEFLLEVIIKKWRKGHFWEELLFVAHRNYFLLAQRVHVQIHYKSQNMKIIRIILSEKSQVNLLR